MGLRDIGSALPPGFRFYPSDEELVCHYLYKKIANEDVLKGTLVEIDLHTCEPWQLPEVAKLNSSEWYFFSFRDRKYATGYRTNRATTTGYWKATGKDRTVVDPRTKATVGMRKTLVFYKNRAPNGIKTGWIMHEFRLENPHIPPKEDWVLCRVFYKAKGENNNNNEFSPENTAENYTAAGHGSPNNLTTSPDQAIDQTMPCGYHHHHHHHHEFTSSSFSQQTAPCNQQKHQNPSNFLQLNHHFLQLSRGGGGDVNEASIDEMMVINNSKSEDDHYGFLFDMGFDQENCSLVDNIVLPPNHLEDMTFDDDDDNGLVFQL